MTKFQNFEFSFDVEKVFSLIKSFKHQIYVLRQYALYIKENISNFSIREGRGFNLELKTHLLVQSQIFELIKELENFLLENNFSEKRFSEIQNEYINLDILIQYIKNKLKNGENNKNEYIQENLF